MLPRVPTRYEKTAPTGVANAVLPNTTVTIGPVAYAPAIYVPIAPDLTEARMAWYFAPGAATGAEFAASREAILDRWLGPTRKFEDGQGDPCAGSSLHGAAAGGTLLSGRR